MLVLFCLSRGIGEAIVIDEQLRVVVAAVQSGRVRPGIGAPVTVRVDRQRRKNCCSGALVMFSGNRFM
jgi:carbon storage regulator CsrA